MNLDQVKQFINQVHWGMLATSDGRKVGVRPMSGLSWKISATDKNSSLLFNNHLSLFISIGPSGATEFNLRLFCFLSLIYLFAQENLIILCPHPYL
jgi:hypothetical protein